MTAREPPSVLVVEDERIIAKDIQRTLSRFGYDAYAIASSGAEAIARASERLPDLVLMDVRIQGQMDGITAGETLRQKFGVPLIYLTAHADNATVERAKLTEPYGYLVKPVKGAELRSAIEVALYKHEMQKRLRERERWFSTTLRSIGDAVISIDLAGKVTFMNPSAESLTGIKAEDALGRLVREVLRLTDHEGRPLSESPIEHALREARRIDLEEATVQGKLLGSRIISDSAAPVTDDGRMLGAVMVFRDVTEQKLAQKRLELTDRLASLGTMAAGVAHEINNPLAVVLANASFSTEELECLQGELRSNDPPAPMETARRLETVLVCERDSSSAAIRMSRIVGDLRSFSRPPGPSRDTGDVRSSIDWAVRSTAHEFRDRARVVVEMTEVPPVKADETKLGQVLVNLLVNAAHAITPGAVEANQVTVSTRIDDQKRVIIEVCDTGHGIPPEILGRIFEPFFTTKPVGVGTGLGLSICHGIMTSLGGDLQVDSKVGEGSVFRVVLATAGREESVPPKARTHPPATARGRLLVVDDEEIVLRTMGRILNEHDVVFVDRAAEALQLLRAGQRFDLIFSDLMMSDMTGMAFYEELLHTHPADAERVVFLTGGATTPEMDDFLCSVRNLCIEKPFDVETIRGTGAAVLGSKGGLGMTQYAIPR
jgi:two-component system, cell cycle sensor histidine kinase and response regulator CckA